MLSDESRSKIEEEERFRLKFRSEIAASGEKKSPWNSLEVIKLVASALTSLVILWFGFMVADSQQKNQQNHDEAQRIAKQNFDETQRINQRNFDEIQRTNQRVIEKRIAIYDQIGTKLNDIYCYFMLVGNWKEIKPPELIANKRALDKIMFTYRPLFSDKLFLSYNNFIDSTFQTFNGVGEDAKLRTSTDDREEGAKSAGYTWKSEWDSKFTEEDNSSKVDSTYKELMTDIAIELGLNINPREGPPKRPQSTH